MRKLSLILFFVLGLTARLGAMSVDCTPGALSGLIENPADITELSVRGSVDASDICFIGREMTSLKALSLADAEIVAYSGEKLNGSYSYPAATIPARAFMCSPLSTVYLPVTEGLVIGDGAFAGSGLTSVQVLGNVGKVGEGAFAACPLLKEASVAAHSAGAYMFADCPALVSVRLSVQEVPEGAFQNCTSLNVLEGASLVRVIGAGAFRNCPILRTFEVGEHLARIEAGAFMGSGILTMDMARSADLRSIGPWAFAGSTLRDVTFPESLSMLGEGAFFDCEYMTSALLPESVRQLPAYLMKGARSVTSEELSLPAVESVGDYAMARMKGLYMLKLPATLGSVGRGAFLGLQVKIIYAQQLPAVPETGQDAFEEMDQPGITLYVSEDNGADFAAADQWREFDIRPFVGVEDAVADGAPGAARLRGRFVGTDLEVSIENTEIEWLALYDVAGKLLAALEPGESRVTVATADMSTKVFIVAARLADGRDATLKIARR